MLNNTELQSYPIMGLDDTQSQAAIDDLNKYSVAIKNRDTGEIHGAGTIVTNDGLILTCYHVVGSTREKRFYYKDSIEIFFPEANTSSAAVIDEEHCKLPNIF